MRSTILFKYLVASQIILNKNIIYTFQKFKSFQDLSQVHSSRTILLAAFQRHFILKGSMEVRQTYYITNELFKKRIIILLFLMCRIFFWELGAVASNQIHLFCIHLQQLHSYANYTCKPFQEPWPCNHLLIHFHYPTNECFEKFPL
jgi:hypothetical protein